MISGTEPLSGRRGFLGVESHNEKDSRADTGVDVQSVLAISLT